jgi:uncharacterized protein YjhX (UPF0386 family)
LRQFCEDDIPSIFAPGNEIKIATTLCKLKIEGSAQGGSIKLELPSEANSGSTVEMSINTTAGQTASEVAASLKSELENKKMIASVDGPIIEIVGMNPGEIGMTTTDAGILIPATLANVNAVSTPEKTIKVTWQIPAGVVYDKIYVYRGRSLVGQLKGDAGSFEDTNIDSPFFTDGASDVSYRITPVRGATPAKMITITMAKP